MNRTVIDVLSAGALAAVLFVLVGAYERHVRPTMTARAPTLAALSEPLHRILHARAVAVRFTVSGVTLTSFRVEQSTSGDDGKTWAPSWAMSVNHKA